MKVLVCGSRSWRDGDTIRTRLRALPRGTTIIHGTAIGADRLAGEIANGLGFAVEEYPADWHGRGYYDPAAGKKRNLRMLDAEPDLVLAFWDGRSTGTMHTVVNARERSIPVEVVEP